MGNGDFQPHEAMTHTINPDPSFRDLPEAIKDIFRISRLCPFTMNKSKCLR